MKIILDARCLDVYPFAREGFSGGTELYVKTIAKGLAARGHMVHVVAPDLDTDEQRGPSEYWWGPRVFPTHADAVVLAHNMEHVEPYHADHLVVATNGIDPWLGPDGEWATGVDAWPCFSEKHVDLLAQSRPKVERGKCHVTGLGVDLGRYEAWEAPKVPGRMLFSNDPARGLWHVLDIFDEVRRDVAGASLHIAYDFNRQFELRKWQTSALAEILWDCKRRIAGTPGVINLGALTPDELVREQLQCQVHVMPSDPPNVGSQIHGLMQLECAAAGAALILSDLEAFPEVFGDCADILPIPGTFSPTLERRIDATDWAGVVVGLMTDEAIWLEASRKSRALAAKHTWGHVVGRFDAMLAGLAGAA